MWFNILKGKQNVPNARTRKEIDRFMETVEGKIEVRDVRNAILKKLGICADTSGTGLLNYLMGWHHEKMENYNENIKHYTEYRIGTGLD